MLSITGSLYYGMECGRPFELDGPEKRKRVFLKEVNISWGQQVTVMFQIDGRGTSIHVANEITTGIITECTAEG